jgi:hypothetical protein
MIEVKGLTKCFGETVPVDDLTLGGFQAASNAAGWLRLRSGSCDATVPSGR